MGLFDIVVMMDDGGGVVCPHGHRLRSFSTKDLEPSMSTYLVFGARLYRAIPVPSETDDDEEPAAWRIDDASAVREQRFHLREVQPSRPLRVYGYCRECEPILVRTGHATSFSDIVREHELLVDFVLDVRPGEAVHVARTSGTREDLQTQLRAQGLHVLDDAAPLAVAHREVKHARQRAEQRRPWA